MIAVLQPLSPEASLSRKIPVASFADNRDSAEMKSSLPICRWESLVPISEFTAITVFPEGLPQSGTFADSLVAELILGS